MSFYVTKASGEQELFNIKKFSRSLQRSGATPELVQQLVNEIQQMPNLRSTKEIYSYALQRLGKENPPVAARYNLKHALLEFGPTGFPFEQYIAALFNELGYKTHTDQIVQGFCVAHELDLIAQKNDHNLLIECKFHNGQQLKSDVKVSLYFKARFDDIRQAWEENHQQIQFHEAWIVTNTKFTEEATKYAQCRNVQLLSWNYPEQENLADLINKFGLHPITALTSLNRHQKMSLIKEGFVLCKDVENYREALRLLHLNSQDTEKLIQECKAVAQIHKRS